MNRLLQMENLERHYETPAGVVKALDGVSIEIYEGERVILEGIQSVRPGMKIKDINVGTATARSSESDKADRS